MLYVRSHKTFISGSYHHMYWEMGYTDSYKATGY